MPPQGRPSDAQPGGEWGCALALGLEQPPRKPGIRTEYRKNHQPNATHTESFEGQPLHFSTASQQVCPPPNRGQDTVSWAWSNFVDKAWISEIFYTRSERSAYPPAMVRTKENARVHPSAVVPQHGRAHARTSATRRRPAYPAGVSKTLSGKFQARIKLNGKRYDLGSNFTSPEEAGAAYKAAKQAGRTDKASPKHIRLKRGTGTSLYISPRDSPSLILLIGLRSRALAGEKALKMCSTLTPAVVPFAGFQNSPQPVLAQPVVVQQPLASRSTAAINCPVATAVALPAGCPALALPVVAHRRLR